MTLLAPTRRTFSGDVPTRQLTRWSWRMVPVFIVVYVTTAVLAYVALGWFGLPEGALVLMAHSGWAWAFDVVIWVLAAAAPVVGAVLASRALRRGAGWAARSALLVNALLVLLVAYGVADEIRMSYWP